MDGRRGAKQPLARAGLKTGTHQLQCMAIDTHDTTSHGGRSDWGATRARMVSRMDKVVNWARRGRNTRESHAHHHDKTKRMQR
jgi:hypothetical protein